MVKLISSASVSLERTCRAFQGLVNDLSLLRQIVETVYHSCRFSNAGIWSSVHLDLRHAKSVCIALEMALRSEGKSAVAIETFLRSRVILAIHSHPLTGAVDLNALQFCLHVARYYKVDDVIPDIAFCLIAATLERGISENHFCELKGVTPSETDSMVVIAFLVVSLHRDSLKEIKETLLRPRLSLIPFEGLLGELPSFLMGLDGTKSFTWRLQSSITPSFLDCEWVGVYLRDWDTLYELNSVRLVKRSGDTPLQVCATINQQPWEIESENYVMTPFGIVVFWQMGASWLWKKEWCDGNFAFARRLPNHEHEPDFIVRLPTLRQVPTILTAIVLLYKVDTWTRFLGSCQYQRRSTIPQGPLQLGGCACHDGFE